MRKLRKETEEIELNLTSLMDFFVALIPFLIVFSAFTQLGGIDLQSPTAASQTPASPTGKDEELWLAIEVEENKVTVTGFNQNFDREIEDLKSEFSFQDLPKLTAYIDGLDARYAKRGPSLFHASGNTKYESAIEVLNALRSSKNIKEIVMAAGVVE